MRTLVYFAADVHLGLANPDPAEREERFLAFLRGIPRDALALYLLGDIWDFWYEYRDVVPREGARVVAELIALMDAGVEVHFFAGNHDIWTYSFFRSLGVRKYDGVQTFQIGDKTFCMAHGDAVAASSPGYGFLLRVFRSKVAQGLFSTLHPWIAYRLALGWSGGKRKSRGPYNFRGEEEPLYKFAAAQKADFCIFGHYHCNVDMPLPGGGRFVILGDWLGGGQPHAVFDTATSSLTVYPSSPRS
ncbi:MAG: UDP-2,3-diacylglucosamine diphosphatase [Bacteroidales bacterium]|nr:UDP-2,3-diacylglucosamine diphosphatase [Bacteroidales bacterium]